MEQKSLRLSLKKKWFDMTKAGIKTEDYREINEYWINRLCEAHSPLTFVIGTDLIDKHTGQCFSIKKFEHNIMTLGYPKTTDNERILQLEHKGIEIRTGNPEWGAEQNKLYFVILHGKPLTA